MTVTLVQVWWDGIAHRVDCDECHYGRLHHDVDAAIEDYSGHKCQQPVLDFDGGAA